MNHVMLDNGSDIIWLASHCWHRRSIGSWGGGWREGRVGETKICVHCVYTVHVFLSASCVSSQKRFPLLNCINKHRRFRLIYINAVHCLIKLSVNIEHVFRTSSMLSFKQKLMPIRLARLYRFLVTLYKHHSKTSRIYGCCGF